MAHLNKLAIRGIRSFDDKQIMIIEFFSPVTVIVGHNGSGKTTIIECLKYATTGDQPPNTRGGAFIHDPKMANEKEVKAQVKLRFHAANGTRMLAVRNLSVSVKKNNTFAMKTLESILALADVNTEKGSKRGVISTKCAEMDIEIPQLLGVSKAVLENVIFCHQEESYWPLAEPAALKKKFDDIFEATRYTKALLSIKGLRKDRLADLKAEKEKLVSLSREKAHYDKLRDRVNEQKATITAKELDCEDSKRQYDALVASNQKFYELHQKFREMYVTVEKLEENKRSAKNYLAEMKAKYQELPGSLEELDSRLSQFERGVGIQKEKKTIEERNLEEIEAELETENTRQRELLALKGRLEAEAEEQARRIKDREASIQSIAQTYGMKGFNHSPLERDKILEFMSRMTDTQRKQQAEYEKLQSNLKAKEEEFRIELRKLDSALESHKSQKQRLKDQASERQEKIKKAERMVDGMQHVSASLRGIQADIEDLKSRIANLKQTITAAAYDQKLAELATKQRTQEDERERLNSELRGLTLLADSRARLDLKRAEVKTKSAEAQSTLEDINSKLKSITDEEMDPASVETFVDQLLLDKETRQSKLSADAKAANSRLQKAETDLSHIKAQLAEKKAESKRLTAQLKASIPDMTVEEAVNDCIREMDTRKKMIAEFSGASDVYMRLLEAGNESRVCGACQRHLDDEEFVVFENHLRDVAAKADSVASFEEELKDWTDEYNTFKELRPLEITRNQLDSHEIPSLLEELKIKESALPELSREAETASDELEIIDGQVKGVHAVKQQAGLIVRLQREIQRGKQEIVQLEGNLSSTGTAKTADDVQEELEKVTIEIRKLDKESKAISAEADRQSRLLRDLENSLHEREKSELELLNETREKERHEQDIDRMRTEIVAFSAQSKDLDGKISEAQAPIDALQEAHQHLQKEQNARILEAQRDFEELNKVTDRLIDMNKNIERYVKEKRARAFEDCSVRLDESEAQLGQLHEQIEASRAAIASFDKEINESGATLSNLRDNIMVQKLTRDIANTQAEIDSYDMEEAAKARRNFQDKYEPAKEREDKLGKAYHQLTGELGSLKAALKTSENDLREFKEIHKQYTDQLIRVKVSDMANNDLEKYAKALDNAIMKYHGLKMEEVNDTMKHLWNKTYQGTDIDGIKIRSDVEGGASNRSYNYRVVMTKDQVEMDMRGRCSAGQKMLASIIIRLALSDSFGQNCGILALDEPTNALDTENIDALASSLVDIINERKTHSNFQLIIITHDENFLRKLGQSDVMEYYWARRVSRDSKQKSVIERQRFR